MVTMTMTYCHNDDSNDGDNGGHQYDVCVCDSGVTLSLCDDYRS